MIFLVDNGSVRADAYRNLCSIASRVSESIEQAVTPAPLLHADKIPKADLQNGKATLLEAAIKEAYESGKRQFQIIPLFFGPSGALVDYLPRRLRILRESCPEMRARILNPLFVSPDNGGSILATILKERIESVQAIQELDYFKVILVDHGSPKRSVTNVRNEVAKLLELQLGKQFKVAPASMERRAGNQYAFNEPLLEQALNSLERNQPPIILAQMFLSPGRHAGPEGDISKICESAVFSEPELQIHKTELMGSHPLLIELLTRRWREREQLPWFDF